MVLHQSSISGEEGNVISLLLLVVIDGTFITLFERFASSLPCYDVKESSDKTIKMERLSLIVIVYYGQFNRLVLVTCSRLSKKKTIQTQSTQHLIL